jgi:hypothetical protein
VQVNPEADRQVGPQVNLEWYQINLEWYAECTISPGLIVQLTEYQQCGMLFDQREKSKPCPSRRSEFKLESEAP